MLPLQHTARLGYELEVGAPSCFTVSCVPQNEPGEIGTLGTLLHLIFAPFFPQLCKLWQSLLM